ncbi:hypothetical protein HY947_01805 [Candidatus Gottesmanbacteria bacterium]|nr:hypothetical protein [Candidatus Gottesmanbacteria bacterium]
MNLITTTELRTRTSELIEALLSGESIDLIHRSKVLGEIKPKKYQAKTFTKETIERLALLTKKMNLPKLTDKQIEVRYRKHLMEKYGKGLS